MRIACPIFPGAAPLIAILSKKRLDFISQIYSSYSVYPVLSTFSLFAVSLYVHICRYVYLFLPVLRSSLRHS